VEKMMAVWHIVIEVANVSGRVFGTGLATILILLAVDWCGWLLNRSRVD
jgi:hypothetical protein